MFRFDSDATALIYPDGTRVTYRALGRQVKAARGADFSAPANRWLPALLSDLLAGRACAVRPAPGPLPPDFTGGILIRPSGTQGLDKAVLLPTEAILASMSMIAAVIPFKAIGHQDLFLPLDHAFGLLGQLLPALVAGGCTRIHAGFGDFLAARFQERKARPGILSGLPSHWRVLARFRDGEAIRGAVLHGVCAGGRLETAGRRDLAACLAPGRFSCHYGLTEAGPRVLSIDSDQPGFIEGSDGRPLPGVEIRLREGDELEFRSPAQASHVWNSAQAAWEPRRGTWIGTGDLFERADGGIRFVGRKDRTLKVLGNNVSLDRVEASIAELPGVDEVAALPLSDPMLGDGFGIVYCGATRLRSRIEADHSPLRVIRCEGTLPRLPSGKTDYVALLRLLKS